MKKIKKEYIDPNAKIIRSSLGKYCNIYRYASIVDSKIDDNSTIGNDTDIVRTNVGKNVAINRRNYINDSAINDFTYTGQNTIINYTTIGKFCSIGRNVDIGGFNHDYNKVTTLPYYIFEQSFGSEYTDFEQIKERTTIGNDVWIASGVNILHNITIGNGAVIGAGSVVLKDIEPYSIVAGVPARKIKMRFSDKIIIELEKIKWWDWDIELILENTSILFEMNVDADVLSKISYPPPVI